MFIAPVEGGFESYLAAAVQQKKVPIVVVTNREIAEFEISGVAESKKASWAKMLFLGSSASKEQAGLEVVNIGTDEVVFAYAVHKGNSARGKQSTARRWAGFETYLKAAIQKKKVPVTIVETREAAEYELTGRGGKPEGEYRQESHHVGLAFEGRSEHQSLECSNQ